MGVLAIGPRSLRVAGAFLASLVLVGVVVAVPALASTLSQGAGNTCGGADTHPAQGFQSNPNGNHNPCGPAPAPAPPPAAPPPSPTPVRTSSVAPRVTPLAPVQPPAVTPAAVVTQPAVVLRDISLVLPRAFVAGEAVHVVGNAPTGCGPVLHVDGHLVGSVTTTSIGAFDVGVVTRDLAAGRHLAEVFCTSPVGRIFETSFWVAAPQSSTDVFFVVVIALFVVFAIGWVALRTLAGPGLAAAGPVRHGPRD